MSQTIRKRVLLEEMAALVETITKLDIDIAVLERSNPNEVVAHKVLSKDSSGKVTSHHEITCSEMIENYRTDRQGKQLRLDVVNQLLEKNS